MKRLWLLLLLLACAPISHVYAACTGTCYGALPQTASQPIDTDLAATEPTSLTGGPLLVPWKIIAQYTLGKISSDCTVNTSTFVITCTKTNGVSFAASATTDTTIASNISSGLLPAARLPAALSSSTSINGTTIAANAGTAAGSTGTFTNGDCLKVGNNSPLQIQDAGPCATGYLGTPINPQSISYTIALSDRGKTVNATAAGISITVPSGTFAAGDVVSVLLSVSGTATVVQGAGLTLNWANGTTTGTGSRTLTGYAMATILFQSATVAFITGGGIS